jgi:hypothetical protein
MLARKLQKALHPPLRRILFLMPVFMFHSFFPSASGLPESAIL